MEELLCHDRPGIELGRRIFLLMYAVAISGLYPSWAHAAATNGSIPLSAHGVAAEGVKRADIQRAASEAVVIPPIFHAIASSGDTSRARQ